jgi:translation initiation factor IF-2
MVCTPQVRGGAEGVSPGVAGRGERRPPRPAGEAAHRDSGAASLCTRGPGWRPAGRGPAGVVAGRRRGPSRHAAGIQPPLPPRWGASRGDPAGARAPRSCGHGVPSAARGPWMVGAQRQRRSGRGVRRKRRGDAGPRPPQRRVKPQPRGRQAGVGRVGPSRGRRPRARARSRGAGGGGPGPGGPGGRGRPQRWAAAWRACWPGGVARGRRRRGREAPGTRAPGSGGAPVGRPCAVAMGGDQRRRWPCLGRATRAGQEASRVLGDAGDES